MFLAALLMNAALSFSVDASPSGVAAAELLSGATQFSYDATEPKKQRKAPRPSTLSEDRLLDAGRRAKLVAASRDIHRNFAIAAWAVRRHLDYVSAFTFHSRNANPELDDRIEYLWARDSKRLNNDVAGRHRLDRFLRLAEARRTLDNDVGVMRLNSGQLQAIEGDRIKNPSGGGAFVPADSDAWCHGVKLNDSGRALAYALHKRTAGGGLEFERTVAASNLFLYGYFDRFDQVRGISPLAASLNGFRDVYENFDYALAKAKVSQLFALAMFRDGNDSAGQVSGGENGAGDEDRSTYVIDFGRGPVTLDLDIADKVEILESRTPSTEFQNFTSLAIMAALKALDIPFSFYDESHTNFFGSRGAWLHYERSCEAKRDDHIELRDWITIFRLQTWILNGELVLPGNMTLGDLIWEHVPSGMPWWDPAKEIRGDCQAISAGLDNPERVCKERGTGDVYDNIDATARVLKYAQEKGVALTFDTAAPAVEVTNANG